MRQGGGGLADVRKHTDLRPGAPVPPGFSGWPRLDGRCLSAPEADYDEAVGELQASQVRQSLYPASLLYTLSPDTHTRRRRQADEYIRGLLMPVCRKTSSLVVSFGFGH